MRVAITGGTGFVGRHLAERFAPDDVVAVSRRTGVSVDDVEAVPLIEHDRAEQRLDERALLREVGSRHEPGLCAALA